LVRDVTDGPAYAIPVTPLFFVVVEVFATSAVGSGHRLERLADRAVQGDFDIRVASRADEGEFGSVHEAQKERHVLYAGEERSKKTNFALGSHRALEIFAARKAT
jgi:hypothetical protein